MSTSNTNNTGIVHAAFKTGGEPLCKNRRAMASWSVEEFKTKSGQCKRCAAKVARMDDKKAKARVIDFNS